MQATIPRGAQPFLGNVFADRDLFARAVDMLLPWAREAAERTDTLIDDAVVDMVEALHRSDLAKDWLASELSNGLSVPEGALAISAMPPDVRNQLTHNLPPARQEKFLNGELWEQLKETFLPLVIQVLMGVLTKR